jgi:hypothetical protein
MILIRVREEKFQKVLFLYSDFVPARVYQDHQGRRINGLGGGRALRIAKSRR